MERKMKRIEELDRKEKEEAALEHARQAMLIEKAEEAAKKKEEAEFKKRVLAEAEREKFEEELRKKKKKEEEDKFFHARLKEMYLAQGYSEESIEIMIKDAEEKKKKGHGNEIVKITEQTKVVDLSKSTWIKVNRKYMSPETLDAHGLPWEWDDVSSLTLLASLQSGLPLLGILRRSVWHLADVYNSAITLILSSNAGSTRTIWISYLSIRGN